jgi:hypothetical protein
MAGNEVDKPGRYPDTWPGAVSRLFELGSESWDNLIRVSILLALLGLLTLLGVVAWLVISVR